MIIQKEGETPEMIDMLQVHVFDQVLRRVCCYAYTSKILNNFSSIGVYFFQIHISETPA